MYKEKLLPLSKGEGREEGIAHRLGECLVAVVLYLGEGVDLVNVPVEEVGPEVLQRHPLDGGDRGAGGEGVNVAGGGLGEVARPLTPCSCIDVKCRIDMARASIG